MLQQSINQVTYDLALYVLAAANGIAWTQEELTEEYEARVAEYLKDQEGATEEEARKYADGILDKIKHELTKEKVLAWAFAQIFPTVTE